MQEDHLPMHVVQINGTYGDADSTGRMTKEMHLWLRAHGVRSDVYAAMQNCPQKLPEGVHLFSSRADRTLHACLSRITGLQGYYSAGATRKLIRRLEADRPDVIVMGVLHSNCIHFPQLFGYIAKNKIPLVLVLHDCFYYTGHCCHYTETGCYRWRRSCGRCPAKRQWNRSLFFDRSEKALRDKKNWFSRNRYLAAVGVSAWICGEAGQSVLKNAAEITCIYNWIDRRVFHPAHRSGSAKRKIILGVASEWTEQKGLTEMLLLAERFSSCIVILAGKLPARTRLRPNIVAAGTIADASVLARYYAAADVFANPSRQETFGKTTAEALCCGVPVAAYDTTACPELVAEGRGRLAAPGDTKGFLDAVGEILKHGKRYYQQECLRFAQRKFDMDTNIRAYMSVFERLIARKKADE